MSNRTIWSGSDSVYWQPAFNLCMLSGAVAVARVIYEYQHHNTRPGYNFTSIVIILYVFRDDVCYLARTPTGQEGVKMTTMVTVKKSTEGRGEHEQRIAMHFRKQPLIENIIIYESDYGYMEMQDVKKRRFIRISTEHKEQVPSTWSVFGCDCVVSVCKWAGKNSTHSSAAPCAAQTNKTWRSLPRRATTRFNTYYRLVFV